MRTVLVVDDEPQIVLLIEKIIGHKYQMLLAHTPERAIELARGRRIDVLVTDLEMPGMSGRELAGMLLDANPGMGVMIISGRAIGHKVHDNGWHLLGKPFHLDKLQHTISSLAGVM